MTVEDDAVELVKRFEISEGRDDIKDVRGKGLGYDLKSSDGRETRLIEVKSKSKNKRRRTSFSFTKKEHRTAALNTDYWLYHIYGIYSENPVLYMIPQQLILERAKERVSYKIRIWNPPIWDDKRVRKETLSK